METHLAGAGSPPSPLLERCLATLREREHEHELRVQGVLHAGVFGSVARGEDHERSDIDVMVELNPEHRVGVYEFVGIELFFLKTFFIVKLMLSSVGPFADVLARPLRVK